MNVYKKSYDEKTITKVLYNHYIENDASDAGEIRQECENLNQLLLELPLNDLDRIWDVAMKLCGLHEERGFEAGFRMAMHLTQELAASGPEGES